jgi:hypothetical protein
VVDEKTRLDAHRGAIYKLLEVKMRSERARKVVEQKRASEEKLANGLALHKESPFQHWKEDLVKGHTDL